MWEKPLRGWKNRLWDCWPALMSVIFHAHTFWLLFALFDFSFLRLCVFALQASWRKSSKTFPASATSSWRRSPRPRESWLCSSSNSATSLARTPRDTDRFWKRRGQERRRERGWKKEVVEESRGIFMSIVRKRGGKKHTGEAGCLW